MVTSSDERRFFHILIRFTFAAVSVSSVLALLAQWHWFAELFTHFRLYYLLLQALLALIFLHSGHRILMAITIVLALPNLWFVGPYLLALTGESEQSAEFGPRVDIVSFNVNFRNTQFARLLEYVSDRDPDIIFVSEFTPAWEAQLRALDQEYPHQLRNSRADQWGVAVFSRLPFSDAELVDLGNVDSLHTRFVIDIAGRPLLVYAVHLFAPASGYLANLRNLQLDDLSQRLLAASTPRLVIGDLNLTPFSPYFTELTKTTGLCDAHLKDGIHVTWPTYRAPLWIPIDHALADLDEFEVTVRAGPALGSDHYPIEIVVTQQESGITISGNDY